MVELEIVYFHVDLTVVVIVNYIGISPHYIVLEDGKLGPQNSNLKLDTVFLSFVYLCPYQKPGSIKFWASSGSTIQSKISSKHAQKFDVFVNISLDMKHTIARWITLEIFDSIQVCQLYQMNSTKQPPPPNKPPCFRGFQNKGVYLGNRTFFYMT